MADPPDGRIRQFARGPHAVADLGLLPDDDRCVEVVDHEGELFGALAPVGRAEHRAEPRRREQELEHAERVLAEPEHTIARPDALAVERGHEPVDALVEFGVGQADGTVD
jgi:hypothetical protein